MKLLLLNPDLVGYRVDPEKGLAAAYIRDKDNDAWADCFPLLYRLVSPDVACLLSLGQTYHAGLLYELQQPPVARAVCRGDDVFSERIGKRVAYLKLSRTCLMAFYRYYHNRINRFFAMVCPNILPGDSFLEPYFLDDRINATFIFIDKQLEYYASQRLV